MSGLVAAYASSDEEDIVPSAGRVVVDYDASAAVVPQDDDEQDDNVGPDQETLKRDLYGLNEAEKNVVSDRVAERKVKVTAAPDVMVEVSLVHSLG